MILYGLHHPSQLSVCLVYKFCRSSFWMMTNSYFKDMFNKRYRYRKTAITIHFLATDIILRFYLRYHADLSLWFNFSRLFPDFWQNSKIACLFLTVKEFFSWPFPDPVGTLANGPFYIKIYKYVFLWFLCAQMCGQMNRIDNIGCIAWLY